MYVCVYILICTHACSVCLYVYVNPCVSKYIDMSSWMYAFIYVYI